MSGRLKIYQELLQYKQKKMQPILFSDFSLPKLYIHYWVYGSKIVFAATSPVFFFRSDMSSIQYLENGIFD